MLEVNRHSVQGSSRVQKEMVSHNIAISLLHAASHFPGPSPQQHGDGTAALSAPYVDEGYRLPKVSTRWATLQEKQLSSRLTSVAVLLSVLVISGLAYMCMRLHSKLVNAGTFHRRLAENGVEERYAFDAQPQNLTAECVGNPQQFLRMHLHNALPSRDLEAGNSKRARLEEIVQRLRHRVAHAPQPVALEPTFTTSLFEDYIQTHGPPELMAAQHRGNAQVGFPPSVLAEGLKQVTLEGTTMGVRMAVSAPVSWLGTSAGVKCERIQGHIKDSAAESSESDAPLTFETGSPDALGRRHSRTEAWKHDEHPFSRLPVVLPGIEGRELFPGGVYHRGFTRTFSSLAVLDRIRELLAKPSIGQQELDNLAKAVETLIYILLRKSSPTISSTSPNHLCDRFAGYFMAYDSIVCAAQLLRADLKVQPWWKEFTKLHATDVGISAPSLGTLAAFPSLEFNIKLWERLRAALAVYKMGVRPSKEKVVELKLMIFCDKYSPKRFKGPHGEPWRLADQQYRSMHGEYFDG
ncbi:hypothetical protein Efla_007775 [Eimeria flavescens]